MSASQRILCGFLTPTLSHSSHSPNLRAFIFSRSLNLRRSISDSVMSSDLGRATNREQKWEQKSKPNKESPAMQSASATTEAVTNRFGGLAVSESSGQTYQVPAPSIQFESVLLANQAPVQGQKAIWKPKSYGTVSGSTAVEVENTPIDKTGVDILGKGAKMVLAEKSSAGLSKLFSSNALADFTVDNSTYSLAQIRATFYPKFENEKSDQEDIAIRKMIGHTREQGGLYFLEVESGNDDHFPLWHFPEIVSSNKTQIWLSL